MCHAICRCDSEVPGVGRCDRDRYNGTEAQLRAFWAAGGVDV
jgi:hypothetical protein